MAEKFYIAALPRSRTAWLARLFTFGKSYCLHDASAHPDFQERMDRIGSEIVGDSDTGISVLCSYPRGKYLVVRRDPAECLRSMLAMETFPNIGKLDPRRVAVAMGRMLDGLKRIEETMPSMTVSFASLDDPATVRKAWDHLVGGVQPWSDEHWEEMRHQRVTVRPETYGVN
jgi:hypothetical protein